MTSITAAQLSQDIAGFLEFKHALGHPYGRGELTLRAFQHFVEQYARKHSTIDLEPLLKEWVGRIGGRKAVTVGLEFGVIRQLCLYRRRSDPHSFVPDRGWAPVVESTFIPYIFSYDEIRQILRAAGNHRGRNIWAGMLRTLILVLYCTGLRLGEAVRLRLQDVDLHRQLFVVLESKGRTRIVPFGADLARELGVYLTERQQIVDQAGDHDPGVLFVRQSGAPLSMGSASGALKRLLRDQGLKPPRGRIGPRPYEFRHAFAVHRLTEWYHKGVDIHARLPWLSAYMGHQNVLGTEVYLLATPELLDLASARFERRLASARRER
jgi:integrase/recombinase XerD